MKMGDALPGAYPRVSAARYALGVLLLSIIHPSEAVDLGSLTPEATNLLLLLVVCCLIAWLAKLCRSAFALYELHLAVQSSQVIRIDAEGSVFNELEVLSPAMFQQLLRSRRVSPPIDVSSLSVPFSINRSSLCLVESSENRYVVQFEADCMVECVVQVYWNVSADAVDRRKRRANNELGDARRSEDMPVVARARNFFGVKQRYYTAVDDRDPGSINATVEMAVLGGSPRSPRAQDSEDNGTPSFFSRSECVEASAPLRMSPGMGQKFDSPPSTTPASQPLRLQYEEPRSPTLSRPDEENQEPEPVDQPESLYPVVIVVRALSPAAAVASDDKDRENVESLVVVAGFGAPTPDTPGKGVVITQLVVTNKAAHEVQEMYGLEDLSTSPECSVCLTDPKDTTLLPCRHFCVCHVCFRQLDRCPVCRSLFTAYLRFKVKKDGGELHLDIPHTAPAPALSTSVRVPAALPTATQPTALAALEAIDQAIV